MAGTTQSNAQKVTINADLGRQEISRHIYGHFAEHLGRCVYEGLYVGEDSKIPNVRGFRSDVVGALKRLNMPNLRWPGGCFADTYHWMDGVGPKEKRPSMVNVHWGGTTENNHCGTHEFLDLCEQIGTEPYICGNLGSGTVREMSEWVEYLTAAKGTSPMAELREKNGRADAWDVKYWGVGNENWGCGGNMRAEFYADEYRRYANYCRHFGGGGGSGGAPAKKLYKVACGFDDAWNETLMRLAGPHMDGLSIHHYTIPGVWAEKGPATGFTTEAWHITFQKALLMDEILRKTGGMMDRYDPARRVGLIVDEWGTWFDVEPGTNPGFLYQQNTLRDALVAGITFNVFHDHAHRVHMANIAQTVNVLQAMVLTEGAKMVLTPTYHVFEMYKVHQDATLLPFHVAAADYSLNGKEKLPHISATASRNKAGKVHVSLVNLHHDADVELPVEVRGLAVTGATGSIITASALDTHNTFDKPNEIRPQAFTDFKVTKDGLVVKLPAKSVLTLELK